MEDGVLRMHGGRLRKVFPVTCERCQGEFHTPKHLLASARFCSRACSGAAKTEARRVEVVCALCSVAFTIPKCKEGVSRSGLHFCSRLCKDRAQRIGGIEAIQPNHYNSGKSVDYREVAFRDKPRRCEQCGFDAEVGILVVHHRDRDRTNNSESNLEILCPNCHATHHYREKTGIYTPGPWGK